MNAATDTTRPTAKQIAERRRVALKMALTFIEAHSAAGTQRENTAETMDELGLFDADKLARIVRSALEL